MKDETYVKFIFLMHRVKEKKVVVPATLAEYTSEKRIYVNMMTKVLIWWLKNSKAGLRLMENYQRL